MYYKLSLLFIYFFIYAILGWICEVIYCYKFTKEFTNRGFLNGPYCPIYGVGSLIVLAFLMPYVNNPLLIFFMGVLLTSSLEYLTSWGMEKLFHAKWWDYSDHKFNINGRVTLLNSFLFGILCLVLVYGIHPLVDDLVGDFSIFWIQIMATLAAIFFFTDLVESTREMVSFNQKLKNAYETATEFKDRLKEKGISTGQEVTTWVREVKAETLVEAKGSAQHLFASLARQIEETKKFNRRSYWRITKAFPKLVHQKHQNSLDIYKAYLEKKRGEKNQAKVS